jgi:hypothetical protein
VKHQENAKVANAQQRAVDPWMHLKINQKNNNRN